MQNGAYKRNGLTACSLGGHDMVLNWMTKITDLLQFCVISVKFGSDYASRKVALFFDNSNVNFFFTFPHKET